jgi:hypothetical protein
MGSASGQRERSAEAPRGRSERRYEGHREKSMKTRSVTVGEERGAEEEERGWRREEAKGRRRRERRRS